MYNSVVLPFITFCALVLTILHIEGGSDRFDWNTDRFSFNNETFFAYEVTENGEVSIQKREKAPKYSRRCFVMCRSALQFHKFATFRPDLPKASSRRYLELTKRLSKIPAWASDDRKPLIFPGYKNLYEFSKDHALLLQRSIGEWWPTYIRPGNYRMIWPFPRAGQLKLARELVAGLHSGSPQTIYITRFKPLNHCLLLFDYKVQAGGDIRFLAYDPNIPEQPVELTFRTGERSFHFQKTWYYKGGKVNAMRVYVSPFH